MKVKLNTISGPSISIDLNEIALIEMHGKVDSKAGFVTAKITTKSGAIVNAPMTPEDYIKLLEDWNPTP